MAGRSRVVGARVAGIVLAVGLCMPVVSCSRRSSKAPAPTSASVTVEAVQTTTSLATTSSMTSAPVTTAATTTTTTTIDRAVKAEAEVRAAVTATIDAFTACLLALPKCDVASLAATRGGKLLQVNTGRVTQWNKAGYAVRDRNQFRYVIESVRIDPGGKQATATVCIADGSKLVRPGASPDGSDVIVDGAYASGREAWDMRLDDYGVWRPYGAPAVGPTESKDICPRS